MCGEMAFYNEGGTAYTSADVDTAKDKDTVNSYQIARLTLQGTECIDKTLAEYLELPIRGNVGEIPPPKEHKNRGHHGDPCCSQCY